MSDLAPLLAAAALRGLATATTGATLGVYAASLGHGALGVGWVTSAGLVGGALATLVVALRADRWGRRRCLLALNALGAVAGALALWVESLPALAALSWLAMWNGMGRDRGAATVIEQTLLPSAVPDAGRTLAFARYHALMDGANAAGFALVALVLGLPWAAGERGGASSSALRPLLALYPLACAACLVLYARLSAALEPAAPQPAALQPAALQPAAGARRARLSPQGRRVIVRLSALFALDSLGGGFLAASLVSYFLFERFGTSVSVIALLYVAARGLNALSHLAAARLARRFGLVNTMVFTHLPSSLLLATVAVAPTFEVAAVLFLLRESLVEMDVPTRQSYVMAVVPPEDRTAAAGITSLVRLGGWAIAPALAGPLMAGWSLGIPLVVGAGLKIAYDLLLWAEFRHLAPPEEAR